MSKPSLLALVPILVCVSGSLPAQSWMIQIDQTTKDCYVWNASNYLVVHDDFFSTVGNWFWYKMTSIARCDEFLWVNGTWMKMTDFWITTYAITFTEGCEAWGTLTGSVYPFENELETASYLVLADVPAWVFPVQGWTWRTCDGGYGAHNEYADCVF